MRDLVAEVSAPPTDRPASLQSVAATELLLAAHRVLYRQEKVDRAVAELTELGYADRFTSLTMHVGEDEGRAALVGPSAADAHIRSHVMQARATTTTDHREWRLSQG